LQRLDSLNCRDLIASVAAAKKAEEATARLCLLLFLQLPPPLRYQWSLSRPLRVFRTALVFRGKVQRAHFVETPRVIHLYALENKGSFGLFFGTELG